MSSNYLPDVVMPPPEPEKPIEDPNADPLVSRADANEGAVTMEVDDRDEETGEENPNFIYSDEELDALAKARETMKANRAEKAKLKAEGKDVPKSKAKQKKEKQVKEIIKEQGQMFTEDQVSKMIESGIAKYDVQRKARKVVKKKKQEEEDQQLKVQRQVQRAMGQPAQDDIWGQALAGLI